MRTNIYQAVIRRLPILMVLLAFQSTALAEGSDLVASLSEQLGISSEKASGGAGAIFDYAKQNLSADDFGKIASGVPGMDGLLSAAPKADGNSTMGQIGSMLGDSGGSLGGLASMASSFESLGLSPEMVSKFVPIVSDYIGSVSGDDAMALLKGLF